MLLPLVVVGDSKVDGSGRSAVPRTCFSLKVGVGGVTAVSGESKREMESCSELSSGDKKSPSWGQAKSLRRGIRKANGGTARVRRNRIRETWEGPMDMRGCDATQRRPSGHLQKQNGYLLVQA